MSEADTDKPQADATFDEVAFDKETAASSSESDKKVRQKRAGSASIAWLALFLALITVAGVGYLLLEKMRREVTADASREALAAVRRDVDTSTRSIATLKGDVNDLSADDARTVSSIDTLRQDIERRAQVLDSLSPRMSNLERSVAALQGVSIEARNTYLIAEAEYYMQIANAQLQLAGNPYLASLALGQADDRLLQLADPALIEVRRAIANELAALDIMEKPDVAGVTLVLASLARVVDSLPMRGTDSVAGPADDSESELGGAARAWAAIKDTASGLITVTRPDDDMAVLITPDVADLARTNLSLQLQAARLALLRGEQEIFEQSLDDADTWLGLYFDTRSEPVRSARQTMSEIRSNYSAVSPPDISQSLRLLRQYKTLAETAR